MEKQTYHTENSSVGSSYDGDKGLTFNLTLKEENIERHLSSCFDLTTKNLVRAEAVARAAEDKAEAGFLVHVEHKRQSNNFDESDPYDCYDLVLEEHCAGEEEGDFTTLEGFLSDDDARAAAKAFIDYVEKKYPELPIRYFGDLGETLLIKYDVHIEAAAIMTH